MGGPRTGKTTLASLERSRSVIATDDLKGEPWETIPGKLIEAAAPLESFLIEGVQVARALRKGLQVDAVVFLTRPKSARKPGQIAMAKAVQTIFNQWHENNRHVPVFYEGAK